MTQHTGPALPTIVSPAELQARLGEPGLLVVDVCRPETYAQFHLPGAVHVEYSQLVAQRGPARGMLPDDAQLEAVFSAIGLKPEIHVVAYDEEGGGRASRLLWTLAAVGHDRYSLLDGGLPAWYAEGRPGSAEPVQVQPSQFKVPAQKRAMVDADYLLAHLNDPHTVILDVRNPAEYAGQMQTATRNGHIPGAVNLEWTFPQDPQRNRQLKPRVEIEQRLRDLGVTPDREVIVHCQTHHRSAYSFMVLKALGYPDVKAYPGSWSDWGNRPDTPIEA